jgi:purine-binding chemotaxis protein CheW
MSTPDRNRIDWEELKRRMDGIRTALEQDSNSSRKETLLHRARRLAQPLPEAATPAEGALDCFCFRVGDSRFLLPATEVVHTFRLREHYRVPGMPEEMPGVLHFRGDLVGVVDLRRLLRLPAGEPSVAAIVATDGNTVALLAEESEAGRALAPQSLCPVPAHFSEPWQRFVKAVTPDLAMLLDLAGICQFLRTLQSY